MVSRSLERRRNRGCKLTRNAVAPDPVEHSEHVRRGVTLSIDDHLHVPKILPFNGYFIIFLAGVKVIEK
jgi:hypothetical protein